MKTKVWNHTSQMFLLLMRDNVKYESVRMRIAIILFALIIPQVSFCKVVQTEKKEIVGGVINSITSEMILNADVYLLTQDSTCIDSAKTVNGQLGLGVCGRFSLNAPDSGKYIVCIKHPKYETIYIPIDVNLKKKYDTFYFKNLIELKYKKRVKTLGEVKVKATLVKFYLKNDTLVYNADAFQTAQGSMLDALIRQLPGVKLKDNGEIYVNGRKVDELLLNGQDFFRNDKKIMLDNLPAYMVKNVKIYEKESDVSKFFHQNIDKKKPLVMDVGLKREYSIGIIGNSEMAYGTKERYLARLFALRFTPHSRTAMYGTINNLNDNRKPGENGEWSPSDLTGGLTATKKAGMDYLVNDKNQVYQLKGNAEIQHQNIDNNVFSTSTNFLKGGDTYGLSNDFSRSYVTSFQTEHSLTFSKKRIYTLFSPSFSYSNNRNHGTQLAAALTENIPRYSKELLDSLFMPNSSEHIWSILINRNRNLKFNKEYSYHIGGHWENFIDLLDQLFSFSFDGSYIKEKNHSLNWSLVEFPQEENTKTFKNQLFDAPHYNYNYSAQIKLIKHLTKRLDVNPFYSYSQNFSSRNRDFYSLDQFKKDLPFGVLPSTHDSLLLAMDSKNTYYSRTMDNVHSLGTFIKWEGYMKEKNYWWFRINLPVNMNRNHLNYLRDEKSANFSRHYIAFEPNVDIEHELKTEKIRVSDTFQFNRNVNTTGLVNMIPWLEDNTDPLNKFKGASDLDNSTYYKISYSHYRYNTERERQINYDVNYETTCNSLAYGYVYDKNTGIKTITPENVNGNWDAWGGFNYYFALDKGHNWTFSTYTVFNLGNNVDMIGVNNEPAQRSVVHNKNLMESLNLSVNLKKIRLSAISEVSWYNATSSRADFNTVNVENYKYGINGSYQMPLQFDLSTDLIMYSRRGYQSSSMNTNDFVWNARLSKSILSNNIILSLEGFDLLHRLSNVTRTINGQGRIERFTNVIPSYLMFHCTYRLNIQPKKRPGDE